MPIIGCRLPLHMSSGFHVCFTIFRHLRETMFQYAWHSGRSPIREVFESPKPFWILRLFLGCLRMKTLFSNLQPRFSTRYHYEITTSKEADEYFTYYKICNNGQDSKLFMTKLVNGTALSSWFIITFVVNHWSGCPFRQSHIGTERVTDHTRTVHEWGGGLVGCPCDLRPRAPIARSVPKRSFWPLVIGSQC